MSNNYFKSQQEIWKYLVDGGAVTEPGHNIVKFVNGTLNIEFSFICPDMWQPYTEPRNDCSGCGWGYRDCKCKSKSEPKPKTKVWLWEKVLIGDASQVPFLKQSDGLYTEEYAAKFLFEYTKVSGSEREI